MELKHLSADFLNLTIIVDKSYLQNDRYHKLGVVNEYAGMIEFVDSFGNVRVTRTNEAVRAYLISRGYTINKGGSVHQFNSEVVLKMIWSKLDPYYGKGYTFEQVEEIIKNDPELQLAVSFAYDITYREDEFHNSMPMSSYSTILRSKSPYLNPKSYNLEFEKLIKPEIYRWAERRDNERAQEANGRGSR